MKKLLSLFLLWPLWYVSVSAQTILEPGDLLILGVNSNTNLCGGTGGEDRVSIVCFKDIEAGTELHITDNGWQRKNPGQWGNNEGFVIATRVGGTIPAGTVITFVFPDVTARQYFAVSPDSNWAFVNLGFNSLNFNSGGDQIYFMQGGTWRDGTRLPGFGFQHDATYVGGRLLFAFNSKRTWTDFADAPSDSGLHPDVTPCYFMAPTGGVTNFTSYAVPPAPGDSTSQLEWIERVANPANWSNYPDCTSYQDPPASIPLKPNEMAISCKNCTGCGSFVDTLTFRLPMLGGPFDVTYTNGTDTFALNSILNGYKTGVNVTDSVTYYLVSVADPMGCPVYSNFDGEAVITLESNLPTTLRDTLCNGASIIVNGQTYDINRPSGREIIPSIVSGCDSIVDIQLTFLSEITVSLAGEEAVCNGDSTLIRLVLNGAPKADVFISDNQGQKWSGIDVQNGHTWSVLPKQNATYGIDLVLTENLTCPIQIAPPLAIRVSNLNLTTTATTDFNGYAVSCAGRSDGAVLATSSGGIAPVQVTWIPGRKGNVLQNIPAGIYIAQATDSLGCITFDSISLEAPPPYNFSLSGASPICTGELGTLQVLNIGGGEAPYNLYINGQRKNPVPATQFAPIELAPGSYNILLLDANNCESKDTNLIIDEPLPLNLELGVAETIKKGDSLLLSPKADFIIAGYEWSPSLGLNPANSLTPFAKPDSTTIYVLKAFDENGCEVQATISVNVLESQATPSRLYLPNSFSPNGDGINDYFNLYLGEQIAQVELFQIFDRWGNLLFKSDNMEPNKDIEGWDGNSKGKPAEAGLYVFIAKLKWSTGDTEVISGEVSLIK